MQHVYTFSEGSWHDQAYRSTQLPQLVYGISNEATSKTAGRHNTYTVSAHTYLHSSQRLRHQHN